MISYVMPRCEGAILWTFVFPALVDNELIAEDPPVGCSLSFLAFALCAASNFATYLDARR